MSGYKVYLNTRVDRIWHVIHALGILLLVLSGANIHFVREFNLFGGIETAIKLHNLVGVVVCLDWLVWFFYNIETGRFRYYMPNRDDLPAGMIKQAIFYAFGIFMGKPHPFPIGENRKFNPLQKWTYVAIMLGLIPFMGASGLYLLYVAEGFGAFDQLSLYVTSVAHTVGAFFSLFFIIVHVYLGTTGGTPTELFGTMVTGYHQEHDSH